MRKNKIAAIILSVIVVALVVYGYFAFAPMKEDLEVFPSENLTDTKMLSDYFDGLEGSNGDTEIYIYEGEQEGGSILILGGTHGNEPAGYMAAILMLENINVNAGTVYIIPFANKSGLTHNDPQEGSPQSFTIETNSGDREFRYGSRATNPIDQWPDPDIYVHESSGQLLSGAETRNLNRSYPGNPEGTFTERVSYSITQLVIQEDISIVIDLHEASPEYPVVNAIVAHDEALDLATGAIFNMPSEVAISLEISPQNLRGLTHRELGDYTDTLAILLESTNPSQGRLRGETNEELVLTGIDELYVKAEQAGRLYVPFDENGHSMEERVGRHIETIMQITYSYNELYGESPIMIENLPSYLELKTNGMGYYLN